MIELNLLPDVKKEFIKAQRTRNTVITGSIFTTMVAGGIVVLLALTVYGGQAVFISTRTNDIQRAEQELAATPEIDKYLTVQNQLSNVDQLHNDKMLYSRAFDYLQQINPAQPNNVALSSVIITKEENLITIQGTARNFEAVNVFQETLKQAQFGYKVDGQGETQQTSLFPEVTLVGTGLVQVDSATLSSFEFTLTTADAAFAYTTTDTTVSVPNLTTSDGDQNAPKQIFGDRPEGN